MPLFSKWLLPITAMLVSLAAKPQKIFFEQLTTAEGLPSDYVNWVFEDSRGFLWIATDKGACRYNGRQFEYFTRDNGLTDNFVGQIVEDEKGYIYFSTYEGGLCVYDGEKTTPFGVAFANVFQDIRQLALNTDDLYIVGNKNPGLYYQGKRSEDPLKISDERFVSLSNCGDNLLLVKSENDVYLLEKRKNNFFLEKIYAKQDGDSLIGDLYHNMFLVLNKDILFLYEAIAGKALMKKKITLHQKLRPGYAVYFYSRNNELWVASNVLMYSDKNNKISYYDRENGLGGNLVRALCEDRQKNLYVCTYGGGIKLWPRQYLTEYKIKGKVNSILPAENGIYITSTRGIYKFTDSKKISEFENSASDDFISIYKNNSGKFFLGSYNGFQMLEHEEMLSNLNTRQRSNLQMPSDVSISGFWQNGHRLFVSTFGGGIRVFDNQYRIIDSYTKEKNSLSAGMVEFLVPLKNAVAALTFSAGLTLIDSAGKPFHISMKEGLLSNTVFSIFQESENELWIGSYKGLNLYNGKEVTKTFSAEQGLTGSKVVCIFRDKQKRFWILSDKYLHLVENDRLRAIRSHPVLYDNNNSINRAAYDVHRDLLFIGVNDGLITVEVNKIVPNTIIRQPAIERIVVDTAVFRQTKERIIIPPRSGKITFGFSNQFVPLADRNDLYYKLAGFDDEWRLLENSSEAVYNKLPAGNYQLMAKTINPDGFASSEISLLKLEVLLPFWKRPWFLILLSCFLLSGFFYTGQIISKKRYKKKILRLQEEQRLQMERERIAMELHDNVGSQLTYLINKIDDDYPLLADKKEADQLGNFARGAMQELRETIWALDKKEVLLYDLDNKIMQLTGLYNREKNIIMYDWIGNSTNSSSVKSLQALNIYRIIQEALNNAVKYSEAEKIYVIVETKEKTINIKITDEGKGFNMQNIVPGYGLRNMKNRASEMNAIFAISSDVGKGTAISLSIPLN